ncbi:hypothetical protein BJ166DRAFT_206280 [Pestalotiopsis sp. NC0098]|nr:hypothetical protein BJ166DRAFT_206280 [Pestalotiopsis sp. NC0098]
MTGSMTNSLSISLTTLPHTSSSHPCTSLLEVIPSRRRHNSVGRTRRKSLRQITERKHTITAISRLGSPTALYGLGVTAASVTRQTDRWWLRCCCWAGCCLAAGCMEQGTEPIPPAGLGGSRPFHCWGSMVRLSNILLSALIREGPGTDAPRLGHFLPTLPY